MKANTLWQVSGSAAELYEQALVPVIFTPWAKRLIAKAGLGEGQSLLDVACGTGIVSRLARPIVGDLGRVAGLDLNPDMLAVARQKAGADDIEWTQGDATKLPFVAGEFDALICQQGLQFFPDRPASAREFRRVLKSGGACVVSVARELEVNPQMRTQVEVFEKHLGPEVANAIRAVCQLSSASELEGLFTEAGFADVAVESIELTLRDDDGHRFVTNMLAATPAAAAVAALPGEKQQEIVQEILDGYGDYYDGTKLAFPHVSNVVTARA